MQDWQPGSDAAAGDSTGSGRDHTSWRQSARPSHDYIERVILMPHASIIICSELWLTIHVTDTVGPAQGLQRSH